MASSIPWFAGLFGTPKAGSSVETSGGFFDRLQNGFEDNEALVLGTAFGLLGHRQNAVRNPLSNVGQMAMLGASADSKERAAKLEEIAKQTEANRTVQLLVSKGLGSKEYIEGLPIAARQAMVDKLFREPAKPETLTLSPGERAYQNGQMIAENPLGPGADGVEWGLQPVYGTDENGNTVLGQVNKAGQFKKLETPGFSPITRDPFEVSRERERGQAAGQSAAAIPSTVAEAEVALKTIQDLKSRPEMIDAMTGWSSLGNWMPGSTGRAGMARHRQISGQAFLTSVRKMQGLGALSNAEGAAATQAATRLDTATSKEEYMSALTELEEITRKGVAVAYKKAGQQPPSDLFPQDNGSEYKIIGVE